VRKPALYACGLFTLCQAALGQSGPPHDPRLERVAWELMATEASPRVLGWAVSMPDEYTIELAESFPEGYRIVLRTETPVGSSPFYASDNVDQRMAATLEHPGADSPCTVGMGRNASGERAQMMVIVMDDGQVGGNANLTLRCFGSTEPMALAVTLVPQP
jgi:hypothetical protein